MPAAIEPQRFEQIIRECGTGADSIYALRQMVQLLRDLGYGAAMDTLEETHLLQLLEGE